MSTQVSADSQRERLRALLCQLEAVAGGVRQQELRQKAEALIADIRRRRAAGETTRDMSSARPNAGRSTTSLAG